MHRETLIENHLRNELSNEIIEAIESYKGTFKVDNVYMLEFIAYLLNVEIKINGVKIESLKDLVIKYSETDVHSSIEIYTTQDTLKPFNPNDNEELLSELK